MRDTSRRLILALLNQHILMLCHDLRRPDVTAEGTRKYGQMLADARRARDELETEALAE
jgi:hypothetical protein